MDEIYDQPSSQTKEHVTKLSNYKQHTELLLVLISGQLCNVLSLYYLINLLANSKLSKMIDNNSHTE